MIMRLLLIYLLFRAVANAKEQWILLYATRKNNVYMNCHVMKQNICIKH